jgi:hypothetical protein
MVSNLKKIKTDEILFGIAFADVLISFSAFLFMLFILFAILPHKKMDTEAVNDNDKLGKVCAELIWDNNRDVDLDLWGQSPVDKKPVGYSNMHGNGLDLYKDVTGFTNNLEHLNMEVMCANKTYPGEWTFNVSYFSDHGRLDPNNKPDINATLFVKIFKEGSWKVLKSQHLFTYEKEEKTMFDFFIGENGLLEENSINSVDKPLRN